MKWNFQFLGSVVVFKAITVLVVTVAVRHIFEQAANKLLELTQHRYLAPLALLSGVLQALPVAWAS